MERSGDGYRICLGKRYAGKGKAFRPRDERKRFLYYSKDLGVISVNHALLSQMENADWEKVKNQMQDDLKNYYAEIDGI